MTLCQVHFTAINGERHTVEVSASSLFEAAQAGIRLTSSLWWYAPRGVVIVEHGGKEYRVRPDRVRTWGEKRPK